MTVCLGKASPSFELSNALSHARLYLTDWMAVSKSVSSSEPFLLPAEHLQLPQPFPIGVTLKLFYHLHSRFAELSLVWEAEGTGVVQPGEKSIEWNLTTLYNYLEGGCSEVGHVLFSQVGSNSMRWYALMFHQTRFRLDIRISIFRERLFKHWNKLPREMVEPPSLEDVKLCCLRTCLSGEHHRVRLTVGLKVLKYIFQTKWSYDSMILWFYVRPFSSCIWDPELDRILQVWSHPS